MLSKQIDGRLFAITLTAEDIITQIMISSESVSQTESKNMCIMSLVSFKGFKVSLLPL